MFFVCIIFLYSCGRAYFPIELKVKSRSERLEVQQQIDIELVPMTDQIIRKANKNKYKRRVVKAGNLDLAAQIIDADQALVENIPIENDPGPYVLGVGDQFLFSRVVSTGDSSGSSNFVARTVTVADDGFVSLLEIGRIRAAGLTQYELEDLIYTNLTKRGLQRGFELSLTEFRSKRILVTGEQINTKAIPYTNTPIFLQDILAEVGAE